MARIDGFRIKNYKTLRDVTLGKLWNLQKTTSLTALTCVIGKNGVGKSTLFDAFGFLADCLRYGVEEACDANGRGGFDRILSKGQNSPIEFEIYYKEDGNARPITYELAIALDRTKRPYVVRERLRQRRSEQKHGQPFSFLILESGKGVVWTGSSFGVAEKKDFDFDAFLNTEGKNVQQEMPDREYVEMADTRRLAIATLGALKQHPRIAAFRSFIESWYLSYFTPNAARSLPLAGPQKHLDKYGNNLGNVVQGMQRDNPKRFQSILDKISTRIPGIHTIETKPTEDGRLLLCFNDKGFHDPFFVQQMSDGTLKLFNYLLLLNDPEPASFICIEEPENGLYHKLLEILAREFQEHATRGKSASQIFVTTHQPYFVSELQPAQVWILEKGADGFSTIRRVSDDSLVVNMVNEGLPLGGLWYSDYLEAPHAH